MASSLAVSRHVLHFGQFKRTAKLLRWEMQFRAASQARIIQGDGGQFNNYKVTTAHQLQGSLGLGYNDQSRD